MDSLFKASIGMVLLLGSAACGGSTSTKRSADLAGSDADGSTTGDANGTGGSGSGIPITGPITDCFPVGDTCPDGCRVAVAIPVDSAGECLGQEDEVAVGCWTESVSLPSVSCVKLGETVYYYPAPFDPRFERCSVEETRRVFTATFCT